MSKNGGADELQEALGLVQRLVRGVRRRVRRLLDQAGQRVRDDLAADFQGGSGPSQQQPSTC